MANKNSFQKVRVKGTRIDGRKASARVIVTDELTDEVREHDVNTNALGDGLWINGKQVTGTCQFNAGGTIAAARAKFRRWFSR